MNIIVAGGTGFIGQALVQHILAEQYQCTVIGRSPQKIKALFGGQVKALTWDELNTVNLAEIRTAAAIINLTGASIGDKRWSPKRKSELFDSRVIPTKLLASLCAKLGKNSPPLLNADGVGIYGLQPINPNGLPPALDENTAIDCSQPRDFIAKLGCAWEAATQTAKNAGVRVINMRFGVVLGYSGGVLKKLELPFSCFIGGPIGSGQQPFCWIALTDLIRAIDFILKNPQISGPVNLVAPQTVTQKRFAHAFGKALHRPSFIPTPALPLKIMFGEMAKELLLNGQHVVPTVLQKNGFQFQYPTIEKALNAIYFSD